MPHRHTICHLVLSRRGALSVAHVPFQSTRAPVIIPILFGVLIVFPLEVTTLPLLCLCDELAREATHAWRPARLVGQQILGGPTSDQCNDISS